MAATPLLECSFYIPIRRDRNLSDGKPHKKRTWQWLHDELYCFRGGTRAIELYEGWYEDPDTHERVEDLSKKYFLALGSEEIQRLREILRQACSRFAQKCIYLSVAGLVEFVEGPTDEPQ